MQMTNHLDMLCDDIYQIIYRHVHQIPIQQAAAIGARGVLWYQVRQTPPASHGTPLATSMINSQDGLNVDPPCAGRKFSQFRRGQFARQDWLQLHDGHACQVVAEQLEHTHQQRVPHWSSEPG